MFAFYYLTNDCNYNCPYCGIGPFMMDKCRSAGTNLRGDDVISLLKVIRSHTDYVAITGGEPLTHPDFESVMRQVPGLKFKKVILATNGLNVEKHISIIAPAVDYIVVSLDTLDYEKAMFLSGTGQSLRTVLANIDRLATHPARNYGITISSVVTPDNIEDVYEVYRFSMDRGFEFAAAPQLVGVKAHDELAGSEDYRQLYNFLIGEKLRGANIYGTLRYLHYMRDLRKFNCYPLTMMVVSPEGNVYYPCLEGGSVAGNLLKNPDLDSIMRTAISDKHIPAECSNQCHSACMLFFSLLMDHPSDFLYEVWLTAKNRLIQHRYEKKRPAAR